MANTYYYTTTYLQKDVAHKLWKLLEQTFGERMNLKEVLERHYHAFLAKEKEEVYHR